MEFKTYSELKAEVQRETDTEAEDFVDETEIKAYFNDAINDCEANIHKLGLEDEYFLSSELKDLTIGQEYLDLPSDIYANKLRSLIFKNQTEVYPIKRLKRIQKFEWYENLKLQPSNTCYSFFILNKAAEGPKIYLVPASWHTISQAVRIWYIRNMNKVQDDSTVIDVPEFYSFIKAFVKWKIYQKEGSVREDSAKAELEEQRLMMIQTLENQVNDEDNFIPGDLSTYEDHT